MGVSIQQDVWLSEVIGWPTFRAAPTSSAEAGWPAQLLHIAAQKRAFYFSKVDCQDVAAVRMLASAGFFVVDVNTRFDLSAAGPQVRRESGITVAPCAPEDAERVLHIAATAFRYSRFHLDPLMPAGTADLIKREWIRSYVAGVRGDRLFVAKAGSEPIGFLAAILSGAQASGAAEHAIIDLVAVDPAHQGRAAGTALVDAFVRHYQDRVRSYQVGTQVANHPSCRFYERLGFRLASSQYVLHLHVRDGKPL